MTTELAKLIPTDAQYDFDAATGLASVTIETRATRPSQPIYSTITARMVVGEDNGEGGFYLDAEYVSHEGEADNADIQYALRVLETNDFGVSR